MRKINLYLFIHFSFLVFLISLCNSKYLAGFKGDSFKSGPLGRIDSKLGERGLRKPDPGRSAVPFYRL